jgi:hypothetical protein
MIHFRTDFSGPNGANNIGPWQNRCRVRSASNCIRLRPDFDQHRLAACQRLAQHSGEDLAGGGLPSIDAIAFRDRAEIDRWHIQPRHMFRFEEASKPAQRAICPILQDDENSRDPVLRGRP